MLRGHRVAQRCPHPQSRGSWWVCWELCWASGALRSLCVVGGWFAC